MSEKLPTEYKTMAGHGFQVFASELSDYDWQLAGLKNGFAIPEFVYSACREKAERNIALRKQAIAAQQKTAAATAV